MGFEPTPPVVVVVPRITPQLLPGTDDLLYSSPRDIAAPLSRALL